MKKLLTIASSIAFFISADQAYGYLPNLGSSASAKTICECLKRTILNYIGFGITVIFMLSVLASFIFFIWGILGTIINLKNSTKRKNYFKKALIGIVIFILTFIVFFILNILLGIFGFEIYGAQACIC